MTADPRRQAAVEALVEDAGASRLRAERLVDAAAEVAAEEALDLISGAVPSLGASADQRVSRLQRLVSKLGASEPLPTAFEVGVLFRITPNQARTVLRTYQARYSSAYRAGMAAAVAKAKATRLSVGGTNIYRIDFDDPAALDYAVDLLRRHGLNKGLDVDRAEVRLDVPRDAKDDEDRDAVQVLGCRRP